MSRPCSSSEFERKSPVKRCPVCCELFGILKWKHHCAWCGHVVCDDCSKQKVALPGFFDSPHRICLPCIPAALEFSSRKECSAGDRISAPNSTQQLPSEKKPAARLSSKDGHRLGGEISSTTVSEERRKLLAERAAARAQKNVSQKNKPPTRDYRDWGLSTSSSAPVAPTREKTPPSTTVSAEQDTNIQAAVSDGSNREDTAVLSPQQQALAAARRRQEEFVNRTTVTDQLTRRDLEEERKKEIVLRDIKALLMQRGEQEPFGIRSMSLERLELYLKRQQEKAP